MKTKCLLSDTDYDHIKEALDDYLHLPGSQTISSHSRTMMPTQEDPEDFIMDGKARAQFWPPKKVFQDSVQDILKSQFGKSPEDVPNEIWITGGFGGDGFSGKDSCKNSNIGYLKRCLISVS